KGSKGNYPTLSKFAKKFSYFPYVKNARSMLYIYNLTEFIRLMIVNNESGIFFPQNAEYSNTSEMVKMIGGVHGKKVKLLKGFTPALKILGLFVGLVNKAFGNLTYDQSISEYKTEYRKFSLVDSIKETEL
ncbi:MAG: NAD-dependent epimerase, partial [Clostridia bacterium]|nr:NAD-dependent epimerase [Clostridia bacterium]